MDAREKSSSGKRLIDANALLLKLKKSHDLFVDAWEGFSNLPEEDKARVDEISNCIADVFNAPTVDAVEVVRCRDCKHRGTDDCIFHIKGEPADEELLRKLDNDFCSYGERKDGDGND